MSTYADADTAFWADSMAFVSKQHEQARAERDRAYALLDEKDYAGETDRILRAIVAVAWEKAEFSANDVRPRLGEVHTPRIGRAFALAQQLGFIEFVGYVTSTDVGTHAKRIGLYRRKT